MSTRILITAATAPHRHVLYAKGFTIDGELGYAAAGAPIDVRGVDASVKSPAEQIISTVDQHDEIREWRQSLHLQTLAADLPELPANPPTPLGGISALPYEGGS